MPKCSKKDRDIKPFLNLEYELCIPIYFDPSKPERLLRAVDLLWSQPQLQGPWRTREEIGVQTPMAPDERDAFTGIGMLLLSDGNVLQCEIAVIPEQGCDWLDLIIPYTSLMTVYDLRNPLAPDPWTDVVDRELISIAEAIYSEIGFNIALIGTNVSGKTDEEHFQEDELKEGEILLSPTFAGQKNVMESAIVLNSGLLLYSRTQI